MKKPSCLIRNETAHRFTGNGAYICNLVESGCNSVLVWQARFVMEKYWDWDDNHCNPLPRVIECEYVNKQR